MAQENKPAPTNEVRASIKVPKPDPFDGDRGNVQHFLTQLRAYFSVNQTSFPKYQDRVLFASGLLRGKAADWFEPTVRNFVENGRTHCKVEVREIFDSFDKFEEGLKNTFGDPDEIRSAERRLRVLRQTGSTSHYAAEFKRVIAKLGWTDSAYIPQFYQGLKDSVKDELSKEERPEHLNEYIDAAIKIDNRIYERQLERKGKIGWSRPVANQGRPRYQSTATGHHAGPMDLDLDAASRDRKKPTVKGKCYNCGKPGHFSNKCRQPRKKGFKPVPERSFGMATRESGVRFAPDDKLAPERKQGSVRTPTPYPRNQDPEGMLATVPTAPPVLTVQQAAREWKEWEKQRKAYDDKRAKEAAALRAAGPQKPPRGKSRSGYDTSYDLTLASGYVDFATTAAPFEGYDSDEARSETASDDTEEADIPDGVTPQEWSRRAIILGTDVSDAADLIRKIVEGHQHEEWKVPRNPRDDPRIHVMDSYHADICWINCYFDLCHKHFYEKVQYKWFPDRVDGQKPENAPHSRHEYRNWKPYRQISDERQLTLVPKSWTRPVGETFRPQRDMIARRADTVFSLSDRTFTSPEEPTPSGSSTDKKQRSPDNKKHRSKDKKTSKKHRHEHSKNESSRK